jgi:hypothetical protein
VVGHGRTKTTRGCIWLNLFFGSQVVIDKYFEQQGKSPYSYVQCDKGEAYIYSHLIRAMKFQMKQSSHK